MSQAAGCRHWATAERVKYPAVCCDANWTPRQLVAGYFDLHGESIKTGRELCFMGNTLPAADMSNTFLEHSFVINNFVVTVGKQIKDSLCRVLGDGVQYQWAENNNEIIIPDVSIICNTRDRKNVSLTGIPRMIMEVVSDATENYDRNGKMEIYRKIGVSEYWIVDWRKKQVEIYLNDGREDGTTYFYLYKVITESNREELQLVMFPNIQISFEELFLF